MLIRLLGGVDVAGENDRRRAVPGKRGCVLAVLAVSVGEPVSVEELVQRVWGESQPELAIGALYAHMTRLRSMLSASHIEVNRSSGGYVLDVDPDEVDVLAVRRLAARAREEAASGESVRAVDTWRRATRLLRGEALAGVDGEWAERVRHAFSAEARSILAERYGWELRLGRHLSVIDELAVAVARYPTSEALVEQLMLALYRSGRQDEALDLFSRAVSLLRDRLGADPSDSLRRLHRQILNQDTELAAPVEVEAPQGSAAARPVPNTDPGEFTPPAQLPASTRVFVGRDEQVEALRRAADRSNVLVVDGMAGVGKTTVAVHTAMMLADRYPDGQLFIDLHGFSGDDAQVSPGDALARMLRALGVGDERIPSGPEERSALLRTELAGRRVLILLDNASGAPQVQPLLPGTADCLTIVTSRRRMPDLVDAHPVTLDVLEPVEAGRLLVAAVGDSRRIGSDMPEVAEIVTVCGRLPLAIRLAAARMRNRPHWTPEYLLRRLRTTGAIEELSGRDDAVTSAFAMSYQELDDAHRRMFRLLSQFPGRDFDAEIAAVIAAVAPSVADRCLEELVDAHLLSGDAPDKYRFHDLMRQYAETMAMETETFADIQAARRRLLDTTIGLLRHAVTFYDAYVGFYPRPVGAVESVNHRWGSQAEVTQWIKAGRSNLTALIRAAGSWEFNTHGVELAAALLAFFSHFRLHLDSAAIAQWGLAAAQRTGDDECESYFLNKLGWIHYEQGDHELAADTFQRALTIRRRLGDPKYIIGSLANLGLLCGGVGRYDKGLPFQREALDAAVTAENIELEMIVRIHLAVTLTNLGQTIEAREHLERADALARDADSERGRALVVEHLGNLELRDRRYRRAQKLHERAIARHRARLDPVREVATQVQLGYDLIGQGLLAEARRVSDQAMAVVAGTERADQWQEIELLQAEIHLVDDRHEDALELLRAGERMGQDRGAAYHVAQSRWAMARAFRLRGDPEAAARYAAEALTYYSHHAMPEAEEVRRFLAVE